MLVLSRRVGQQIRIGKSVVVTLLKVDRNKARIGVDAPAGVPVFRQELLDFDRQRPIPSTAAAPRPSLEKRSRDAVNSSSHLRGFSSVRTLWDCVSL